MVSFKSLIPKNLGFDDCLEKGKYSGYTVQEVLSIDPSYVVDISSHVGISQEVLNKAFELYDVPQ